MTEVSITLGQGAWPKVEVDGADISRAVRSIFISSGVEDQTIVQLELTCAVHVDGIVDGVYAAAQGDEVERHPLDDEGQPMYFTIGESLPIDVFRRGHPVVQAGGEVFKTPAEAKRFIDAEDLNGHTVYRVLTDDTNIYHADGERHGRLIAAAKIAMV